MTIKTIDLKVWERNLVKLIAAQGEINSRKITVNLIDKDGSPYGLVGCTARIYIREASGRNIFANATISDGKITAPIPTLTSCGCADAQIVITGTSQDIIKITGIIIDVQPSKLDDAISTADDWSALYAILSDPQEFAGELQGYAETAKSEANRAKAEADRVQPEQAYGKGVSDGRYAPHITEELTVTKTQIAGAAAGYGLAKASFVGETAESGSGEKSPSNPYTIAGKSPTNIHVDGKNVLDINAIMQSIIGSGGTAELVTFNGKKSAKLRPGGQTDNPVIPLYCLPGSYTLTYQYYIDSADKIGFRFDIRYTDGTIDYIAPTKYQTWDTITRVTNPNKVVKEIVRVVISPVTQYIALTSQMEYGATATTYEPYAGAHYTIPSMPDLYSVGSVADDYNAITGCECRNIKRIEFDGTEDWYVGTGASNPQYTYFVAISDKKLGYQTSICSHFKNVNMAWSSQYGHQGDYSDHNATLYQYYVSDQPTLEAWKAWLAAQKAAGTPVTVLYQLADLVITQHTPQYIAQPASTMSICADAPLDIAYNKDANMVIASLDNRIKQLEAAMTAMLGGE